VLLCSRCCCCCCCCVLVLVVVVVLLLLALLRPPPPPLMMLPGSAECCASADDGASQSVCIVSGDALRLTLLPCLVASCACVAPAWAHLRAPVQQAEESDVGRKVRRRFHESVQCTAVARSAAAASTELHHGRSGDGIYRFVLVVSAMLVLAGALSARPRHPNPSTPSHTPHTPCTHTTLTSAHTHTYIYTVCTYTYIEVCIYNIAAPPPPNARARTFCTQVVAARLQLSAPRLTLLSLFLLADRRDAGSFYQPYYRALPRAHGASPLCWSAAQRDLLLVGSHTLVQVCGELCVRPVTRRCSGAARRDLLLAGSHTLVQACVAHVYM
jgi:hypothetical protein